MQSLAFDSEHHKIFAHDAVKGENYSCLACGAKVRRRGGDFVRDHFYHLQENRACHLSQKSETHFNLQLLLSELLPPGEALIEERFKEINRIADVAWPRYKIIFEIQYSPLSFEEMESRILDYQSIGWTVIWILHLHSFFKGRPSREELLLAPYPHYYSNHTREGKGYFFDVSWKNPHPPDIQNDVKLHFPLPLQKGKQDLGMRSNWPIHFSGDFIERFFNGRFQFPHLPQKTPFSFSRFLTSAYQYFIEGVFRSS